MRIELRLSRLSMEGSWSGWAGTSGGKDKRVEGELGSEPRNRESADPKVSAVFHFPAAGQKDLAYPITCLPRALLS